MTNRPAVLVALAGGDPQSETDGAKKLNWPLHVMHGTAVGAVLAALSLLDLSGVITTVIFYLLLLGVDWGMYVALG